MHRVFILPLRAAVHAEIGLVSHEGGGKQGPDRTGPSVSQLAGLGAVIAVAVLVPLVAGLLVDNALHSSPLGLLLGLLVGAGAATMTLISRLRQYL